MGELKEAFSIFDKDSDGTITVDELGEILGQFGHDFTKTDLKKVIDLYDKNKDGDGSITADEIAAVMEQLGEKVDKETITFMIEAVDNSDGTIDKTEFRKMLIDGPA